MKKLNPIAKAYIAAMIDGEGVITISKAKSTGKTRSHIYVPRIIITNSCLPLILLLREAIGFGCVYHNKISFKPNWSPIHRFQLTATQARELLVQLKDFLVIKRVQAEIVLKMPSHVRGGRGIGFEEIDKAQKLAYQEISLANQRGKKEVLIEKDFIKTHPVITGLD